MINRHDDPHDITNNVYHPKDDPWDTIDKFCGIVRDAFAAIGIFFVVVSLAVWWSGKV